MKFREFILESKRRDIMYRISEVGYQVYLHLIKLLYYKDPDNINHHIYSIITWIDKILMAQRQEDFDQKTLKQLMMGQYGKNKNTKQKVLIPYDSIFLIDTKLTRYHKLPKMRTVKELDAILSKIYDIIAHELSEHRKVDVFDIVMPYIIE